MGRSRMNRARGRGYQSLFNYATIKKITSVPNGPSLSCKRLQPRNLRDRGWGDTSGTVHSSMRPVPSIKGVRFDHNLCSCYH